MQLRIIPLFQGEDDFGLYGSRVLNDYGTPLYFRGTFAECVAARRLFDGR